MVFIVKRRNCEADAVSLSLFSSSGRKHCEFVFDFYLFYQLDTETCLTVTHRDTGALDVAALKKVTEANFALI